MKKKTMITIGSVFLLSVALTACGAFGGSSSAPSASSQAAYAEAGDYAYESVADEEVYYSEDAIAMAPSATASKATAGSGGDTYDYAPDEKEVTRTSANGSDGGESDNTPPQPDGTDTPDEGSGSDSVKKRKLITTVSIEAETETLDSILQRVESEVEAFGGYIESSYIAQDRTYAGNNTYTNRRRATLTLRVPESKLETVLSTLSGETNVLEESRTTEDITLTYVDIESRKKSLETQRESLLRLMEKAETVEDIITIEDRLSYVNYEIERMGGQLRSYDNLVDFATVHLTLREVVEYTPVQEEPETVFSRIAKGFSHNLKSVGGGIVDFFVWFVSSLPQIAVFAVVIAVFVKAMKWLKKRSDAKKSAEREAGGTGTGEKKGLRRLFGRKKGAAQEKKSESVTGDNQKTGDDL